MISSKTYLKSRVEEARLRSNLILIENYEKDRIVSSCLQFNELINADTFKLKLNLYLVRFLSNFYKKRGMDDISASEKCSK
jgi:hypothetical protein